MTSLNTKSTIANSLSLAMSLLSNKRNELVGISLRILLGTIRVRLEFICQRYVHGHVGMTCTYLALLVAKSLPLLRYSFRRFWGRAASKVS